jgi:hypothetical protein
MIELVEVTRLEQHDAVPCAHCDKPAESIESPGFYFCNDGERVCIHCAVAAGFTIKAEQQTGAELLTDILRAYHRRPKGAYPYLG